MEESDASHLDNLFDTNETGDPYSILGCDVTSSLQQIQAEYRHRIRKLHPDKNTTEKSTNNKRNAEFERVSWAYQILSDVALRAKCDYWKRTGLNIPFKTWLQHSTAAHLSVHWALKPKKELMIEEKETAEDEKRCSQQKEKNTNLKEKAKERYSGNFQFKSIKSRFKNYEI